MSYDSRIVVEEGNNPLVGHHRRDANFGSAVQYTSSVVINLRQLQNELNTQHQHDKGALTELNQRFQVFLDRVHQLQVQNSKYLTAIAELRHRHSGATFDVQLDERYFSARSDLLIVHDEAISYKWDYEMFQLQMAIYQQLIEIEQQWRGKRLPALEGELNKSASVLNTLRVSYTELQRSVEILYVECDNLFKRYLALTHDWCHVRKERHKWELRMETLKTYIAFYKNIRSYSTRVYESSRSIKVEDSTQYWTLELEKVIRRVRSDFEAYYTAVYREMVSHYKSKMEEVEVNVEKAMQYQKREVYEYSSTYQSSQVEYEKMQKSLSYEKEAQFKLDAAFAKLEGEYRSIQIQNGERFDAQAADLRNVQESIMAMVYEVDEIRRRKANLEAEIIVYRLLLDSSELDTRATIHTGTHIVTNDITAKFALRKSKIGSIEIKEIAPNGAYITLANLSRTKDVDISRWVVERNIDSSTVFRYTIPEGIRLARGTEIRIYAKSAASAMTESSSQQKLVNKELISWGTGGRTIETRLFNQSGNEEALYSQSLV